MLVVTGLLAALFLMYVVYLQSTVILEARRNARQLQAQRRLADEAEASRFTELRAFLEDRISKIEGKVAQLQFAVESRLDRLDTDLRATIEQTDTVLSGYIGEVETVWSARLGPSPPHRCADGSSIPDKPLIVERADTDD